MGMNFSNIKIVRDKFSGEKSEIWFVAEEGRIIIGYMRGYIVDLYCFRPETILLAFFLFWVATRKFCQLFSF